MAACNGYKFSVGRIEVDKFGVVRKSLKSAICMFC